jgi:hypothetical protein
MTEPLSDRLLKTLQSFEHSSDLTFGKLMHVSGRQGFGFLLAMLCIPGSLPIGTSLPFGILMVLLGFQLIFKVKYPHLPHWAMRLRLKSQWMLKGLHNMVKFLKFFEAKTRVRWAYFHSSLGLVWVGCVVVGLGFIIALPLPFSNTVPSLILLLIALALSLMDGLILFFATILGSLLTLVYVGIAYYIMTTPYIKTWLDNLYTALF